MCVKRNVCRDLVNQPFSVKLKDSRTCLTQEDRFGLKLNLTCTPLVLAAEGLARFSQEL